MSNSDVLLLAGVILWTAGFMVGCGLTLVVVAISGRTPRA